MSKPVTAPHCECGLPAMPIYETIDGTMHLVGYYCLIHGDLTHDALVWPPADDKEST